MTLALKFAKPAKRGPKPRLPVRTFKAPRGEEPAIKTLDHLARDLCRTRGVCEAAGYALVPGEILVQCKGYLQWAHIVTRSYHRLRWLPEGCLYLCAAHHVWFTYHPVEWRWFVAWKFGSMEALEALERRATSGPKPDRIETVESLRLTLSVLTKSGGVWSNPLVIR